MMGAFLRLEPATTEKRARYELRRTSKPSLDNGPEKHPPGTVLIRTIAASICGSDFVGKGPNNNSDSTSFSSSCPCGGWRNPLDALETVVQQDICGGTGHELLGEIVQIVEPCHYSVGKRVLAFSPIYFKVVLTEEMRQITGISNLDSVFATQGGFAEYFVSHQAACVPVPTTTPTTKFDPRWFVLAQPLGTALHACQHLENVMGKTVAVVGQGQNGLIMTQLLAGYRPKRLIVLDLSADRLEAAKHHQYGVTHALQVQQTESMIQDTQVKIKDITNGELCDVVIDMVGHQSRTMDMSCQLAKSYGTVLLFGLPPSQEESPFAISTNSFQRNLKFLTSHLPPMETFAFAMELLEQGRFDPSGLFTHTFPFRDSFPTAYDMAQNYQDGVIKVLVTFEDGKE